MVCGYDISANTQMGNVSEKTIEEIWHGEGFQFYRDKHLKGRGKNIDVQVARTGNTVPGNTTIGKS